MSKKLIAFILLYTLISNNSIAYGLPIDNISASNNTAPNSTATVNSLSSESLSLTADSAVLIDAKTGAVIYNQNCNKKQFPASITKLMTVLLALEYGKLDDVITFSAEAVFGIERNSSHIAIDVGEQITMEEALYAIMLQSANEVSLGVAEHIDGSIEAFATHMNKRASELGCTNTNFVTPNGLHDENHYSTAYDMALIMQEVLKFDEFKKIAATTYYELKPTNKQPESRYLYAQHKMIKENSSFYYEGCEGGKTGFTNQAQNTLVTSAKKGDTELIAVVLKDIGTGIYKDTTTLLNYGFENFETVEVFSAGSFSRNVAVTDIHGDNTYDAGKANLKAEDNIFVTLPKNASKKEITEKINCSDSLVAPIEKGSVNGSIETYYKNKLIGSTNIIATNGVDAIPYDDIKEMKKASILGVIGKYALVIVILIIVVLIIIAIIKERRFRKQIKLRRKRFKEKYRTNRN